MGKGCSDPHCPGNNPAAMAALEAHVAAVRASDEAWVAAWRARRMPDAERVDLRAYVAKLPAAARAIGVRFPLGALVRARSGRVLLVPPPGLHARVIGYREQVGPIVDMGDESPTPAVCTLDDLELVACVDGIDAAFMQGAN